MKLFVFPTPENAICVLRHDDGNSYTAKKDTHPTGRPGQSFELATNAPDGIGASLDISADGFVPLSQRGVLYLASSPLKPLAALFADDFHLPTGAGRFL